MLLKFNSGSGIPSNKVAAIKVIRNYTGFSLRESKKAVDEAQENGEATVMAEVQDVFGFNQELRGTGWSVVSSELELIDLIEQAIALAVEIKEYKKARTLINILPSVERSRYDDDNDGRPMAKE